LQAEKGGAVGGQRSAVSPHEIIGKAARNAAGVNKVSGDRTRRVVTAGEGALAKAYPRSEDAGQSSQVRSEVGAGTTTVVDGQPRARRLRRNAEWEKGPTAQDSVNCGNQIDIRARFQDAAVNSGIPVVAENLAPFN